MNKEEMSKRVDEIYANIPEEETRPSYHYFVLEEDEEEGKRGACVVSSNKEAEKILQFQREATNPFLRKYKEVSRDEFLSISAAYGNMRESHESGKKEKVKIVFDNEQIQDLRNRDGQKQYLYSFFDNDPTVGTPEEHLEGVERFLLSIKIGNVYRKYGSPYSWSRFIEQNSDGSN